MQYFSVTNEVKAEKPFKLESPKVGRCISIDFADVDNAVMLRRTGFCVKIDEVVDGSVSHTEVEALILSV